MDAYPYPPGYAPTVPTPGEVVAVIDPASPNHGREGPITQVDPFRPRPIRVWFEDGSDWYQSDQIRPIGRREDTRALPG